MTGERGSNPEPTAHTCTTSERSAAVESAHKHKAEREREEKHINLPNQPVSQHFIHSENIWNVLNLLHAALAVDTERAPRPEICGALTPTFSWSDLYAR